MKNQVPRLGIDRFLALRWVNLALELRIAGYNKISAKEKLNDWLLDEISGKETKRKTINHLIRLWFDGNKYDPNPGNLAINYGLADITALRPILHYGMGLFTFPLLRDVSRVIGRFIKIQGSCHKSEILFRVIEKYGNPVSNTITLERLLHTLVDWGIVQITEKVYLAQDITVSDAKLIEWLIVILLLTNKTNQFPFTDLLITPDLVGIKIIDARSANKITLFRYYKSSERSR